MLLLGRPIATVLVVLEKALSSLALSAGALLAVVLRARHLTNPLAILAPREFHEAPPDGYVMWISHHLPQFGPTLLLWIALGLLVWAVVLALEAYGVWFDVGWGELLLIIETCLLLPIEVVDIVRSLALTGFVTLMVNLLVLVYVIRLYRRRDVPGSHRVVLPSEKS